jgi:hypothetical protein
VLACTLRVRFVGRFEFDIIAALSSQLGATFESLEIGHLSETQIAFLEPDPAVYQLFYKGVLAFVGQAQSLRKRLREHHAKISGRKNIDIADIGFKCLTVHPNWTALIRKYHRKLAKSSCPWNGNGFGPDDPGRERETTNKATEGFDAIYPIRENWPCSWITAGEYTAEEILRSLKSKLPYLLRFETAEPKSSKPHPDVVSAKVSVLTDGMPANDLLKLVAMSLPGWQATIFPGHMILYKEQRSYKHGKKVWPAD